jgi:hypothetical protein
MFDKQINVISKHSSSTTCVIPEKIEVDIVKDDEQSFFVELSRNSKDYENLLGENPFTTKKQWVRIKDGDNYYDRRDVLAGGRYEEIKTTVKILRMTYTGNGKFLFELKNK